LLFLLTGLAIVVYLNQTPYQPRERDYAYAGSFYAFCIWIGFGVLALIDSVSQSLKSESGKTLAAAVVTLVTLLVPAQMASQNWDDHDRSQRYVCRDFGANYLKSCQPNGIIFSNGDNDTFPLWYNQEVEGVGTDLRVCNLSYLQTDWYISQMKRPYYDSPALPISWEYKDFMPGTNEVVWTDNRLGQPLEVSKAFQFLRSDDPKTKNREGENYLPSDQLYVLAPDGSQILMKKARRFTRSEMMIMEMLSQNNWQRPMYFAVSVGPDYYMGLEPYFECTGLAYRITPNRSPNNQSRVAVEEMYDNMMNKFQYGNCKAEGIYLDENTQRMCRTHRMMFSQLAEVLVNRHDYERATAVLDKAFEELPGTNIPYDYTAASMAILYLRMGEKDKAAPVLREVAKTSAEYILWGKSLSKEHRKAMKSTIDHHDAVLGYILQQCERNGLHDIVEDYYRIYDEAGG
jgi:tetratricopeptide (TPR) repeat protein